MNWYKIGTSEAEQLWWEGGWMYWVWNIQLWGAGKGCSAVEWLRVEHIGGSRLSLVCTWDCTWNVQRVRRDRPSIGEHHGGSGKEERPLRNSEVEGEARVSGVMETQEWCFFRGFIWDEDQVFLICLERGFLWTWQAPAQYQWIWGISVVVEMYSLFL